MIDIQVYLPFPPTVNSYYQQGRPTTRGKPGARIISRKGRQFREQILAECVEQLNEPPRLADHVRLVVCLHPPDRRIRDLDNYMKALLDALTHAELWEDDSLVDQLEVYRGSIMKNGQTRIQVTEAGPVLPPDYWP